MSQLQQTEQLAVQSFEQGLVNGRVQIDFLQPGFTYEAFFRKLLVIDGEEVPDKLFDPSVRRAYPDEATFRQAIREAVAESEQLASLVASIPQDPSLLIDAIAALNFGLLQQDLASVPEVIE